MKKFICAILSLMLFVACSEEITDSSVQIGGDESVTPSITLNQTSINFDEHAYTQEITFNSAMAWTAELINERADGWCSISPTSGSAGSGRINVTVTENSTPDDRTASVIIKSGEISRTVRIMQKQQDALTVTASSFEVEGTEGKIYIEVKANIDFEYTINGSAAEWITPIETRAMKTTTLGFNIAENKTMQRREGTITIHSGAFSETVTVYQKDGGEAILLSQSEYVVSDAGEDIAVEVTSNVDVEIEMPDVDWITRNVSRAVSTNTYYFTVAENATYDQREAYITFKNTEKNITERVKVTQVQRDAIVLAKSEYEMEQDGGALDFDIQTNVDVSVTISEDAQSWITQVQTRGLETRTLFFDISAYEGDDMREGTITITGGGATQTVTVRQLSWQNLKDNKIFYTSSDGNVIAPNFVESTWGGAEIISNTYDNGHGVISFNQNLTEIGWYAFYECSTLTSIIIPNKVSTIGAFAFCGCANLAEVHLGEGVQTIEEGVFGTCLSITNIIIPKNVSIIDDFTFYGCVSLLEISLSDNIISIGQGAFGECASLKNINIPNSVTSIGDAAFEGCSALAELIIPNNVTEIGSYTFNKCRSLTELIIPNSVIDIGNNAFEGCSGLINLHIGDGVTYINELGINSCSALTNVVIGNSVIFIDHTTFKDLKDLTSVTIGNGVTEIRYRAFENCSALTRINIPNCVTKIEEHAFDGCSALANITFGSGIEKIYTSAFANCISLTSINIPDNVKLIGWYAFSFCSSLENVCIGDGIKEIEDNAFLDCFSLTNLTLGDNIAKIHDSAFRNCSALTKINIPNSVIEIGESAFYGCTGLTSVHFPENISHIGRHAFWGCKFISITIPESIKVIGAYAFDGASKPLKSVYCKAITPPEIGFRAFSICTDDGDEDDPSKLGSIFVPSTSVNAYKSAFNWSYYENVIYGYNF